MLFFSILQIIRLQYFEHDAASSSSFLYMSSNCSNIRNEVHIQQKGCTSELDYVEQTSWILFLKYLDDLEKSRKLAAELQDKTYEPIIAEGYRWNDWAMTLQVLQWSIFCRHVFFL